MGFRAHLENREIHEQKITAEFALYRVKFTH